MILPHSPARENASRAPWGRRRFLQASLALLSTPLVRTARGDDAPPVTHPRATSGDTVEPEWTERLAISVGHKQADLVGDSEKVIQAAVDYVAARGGGTVNILPGTYRCRNAVYLQSGVRIVGSGDESILIKEPSTTTRLAEDSDWYDQEITVVDAGGLRVGDGVCLKTKNPHNGSTDVVKRTLVARDGNRFKLDRALRKNFWTTGESTVSTLFPLFSGEEVADIVIENVALDGNKLENDNLNGNYAGCVFLQDASRITLRNVTARNYNGDGISWQICHDVVVENCSSHDNTNLGLHPGSGSQRPVIRGNTLANNDIGIFFCWGVKYGLAEDNRIEANRLGVSIGHRDTDNLVQNNYIADSRESGVLFRPERGKAFAPHRNRLVANQIIDSGGPDGVAVDVQGETEEVNILDNQIRETRAPMQRTGVRLGRDTKRIRLSENRFEGFAVNVADERGK